MWILNRVVRQDGRYGLIGDVEEMYHVDFYYNGVIFLTAALMVSLQLYKALIVNPVDMLRDE